MGLKSQAKRLLFSMLPSSAALMFHHIDDGQILHKSGCILSKDKFLNILDAGISFVPVETYLCGCRSIKNPCTITFDDGLEDVYRVAYPELKKRNIPFTVFIVTDFLDTPGYLTTAQLKELAGDALVTIGSHGLTHEILAGMPEDAQRNELESSREILERKIGKPVRLFAYSHGQYDGITHALMKNHDIYDYAFGAGGGVTNAITSKDKFCLPRMNCENDKRLFTIKHKRIFQIK